jgi:ribonuclease HI
MEKIASNERIANIEANVDLNIAEAEANAQKVEALLDSISSTFGESTKFAGDLFELLGDADNFREKWGIEKQIKKENELRDDQMKLQKKLTEAEVEWVKEKTRQLRNGDAKLTINAAGLEPHLEAIWFQILEKLQAKVNAEGEEMLLGLKGN